jgi:hypothetical protein
MEIAQAGRQCKYEMRRKKCVKGKPKTLFNIWVSQQLDSMARHGKSLLETSDKKGLVKFGFPQ